VRRALCLRRTRVRVLFGALVFLAVAGPARSQQRAEGRETNLLRQASALEATGDLDGAVAVLFGILGRYPGSSRGLDALERVLRSRGTLRPVFTGVDRQLQLDAADPGAWFFKLRMMAELDSVGTIETEARRWVRADPGSPEPYRGIAHLYQGLFGPRRALVVLEEGREAVGDPEAFAVEIGGALLELGRTREALEEWGPVVGFDRLGLPGDPEGPGGDEVDGAALAAAFIEGLAVDSGTTDQRRAGIWIAMRLRLLEGAWRLAERVQEDMGHEAGWSFLRRLGREAEAAEAPELALRAYQRLGEIEEEEYEGRWLDVDIVRVALEAGRSDVAREAEARIFDGLRAGSAERRVLMARLIEVEVIRSLPEEVAGRVRAFRDEFPEAPELDRLAARSAAQLHERGERDAARRILEGVDGPHSSLERAYLMLDAGEYDEAGAAFFLALPALPPAEATPVIQLMTLVDRLGPAGRKLAAESAILARRGRTPEALDAVRTGIQGLSGPDQAALLAQTARLAGAAGLIEEAAELRDELLDAHPDAPEVEEATLALARHRASYDGDVEEALRLLEALILTRPNAALVPDARRELERLRREGSPNG